MTTQNTSKASGAAPRIEDLRVSVYEIPTDGPDGAEADGTFQWTSTTMVVVEVACQGVVGLGYTYGNLGAAHVVGSKLREIVRGRDPFLVGALWREQLQALRNSGRSGIAALAVSAVDTAIWDLKAKLLGQPLFRLLGAFHQRVPIYASGGFCNYPLDRLASQVAGWVEQGIPRVKIKTSRNPDQDPQRLATCRKAIGDAPVLMTDSNGGLTRKQALYWAWRLREEWNVVWMEEPVSSEDREGLRLIRDQGPPGLDVAAGEYGFVLRDFADLLEAGAVDCLQVDITRCGGVTGLLQVAGLSASHEIDLSGHCAPSVSAHVLCGVERLRHLEYFHDHVRIEQMFFDGFLRPQGGQVMPDPSRPGLGLEFKRRDAERFMVFDGAA